MSAVFMMLLGSCLTCGTVKSTLVNTCLSLMPPDQSSGYSGADPYNLLLVVHILPWHPLWPCA